MPYFLGTHTDDCWDAASAWDTVEPDETPILRRAAEAQRVAEAERERRRIEQEECHRIEQEDDARRQQERMMEEEAARRRAEEHALAPAMVEQIKQYEQDLNRTPLPTPHQLHMDPDDASALHQAVNKRYASDLPDPFPDDDRPSILSQIIAYSHKLEPLPEIVIQHDTGESSLGSCPAGMRYNQVCQQLHNAIRMGLYRLNINLARDLTEPHLKRLISYYKRIEWRDCNTVDLVDAWERTFQAAILFEPDDPDRYAASALHILEVFSETEELLHALADEYEEDPWAYLDEPEGLARRTLVSTYHRLVGESPAQKLYVILRDRTWSYQRPPVDATVDLTRRIVFECARFFMDTPDAPSVTLLRSVAYGLKRFDFAQHKLQWLDAVKALPTLHYTHPLWPAACRHARVQDSSWISKEYFAPYVHRW